MRAVAASLVPFALVVAAACSDPVRPEPDTLTPPAVADTSARDRGDTLFAEVTAGYDHFCALTRGGRVFCWGGYGNGFLGTPGPACRWSEPRCYASPVPVRLPTAVRFRTITANGSGRTCGLSVSGAAYCWGDGTPFSMLIAVHSRHRFAAIQQSGGKLCFLDADGRASCNPGYDIRDKRLQGWGTDTTTPTPLSATLRFTDLGANCGTTADGSLYCWERRVDAVTFDTTGIRVRQCRVGREGTYPCTSDPMRLRSPVRFARASTRRSDCAIGTDGQPYCWVPMEGLVWPDSVPHPAARVETPLPVRDILRWSGAFPTTEDCVHAVDGRVLCRGYSWSGEWGNGLVDQTAADWTPIAGGRSFVSFASTGSTRCGVTPEGAVLCWGEGSQGHLGTGTTPPDCRNRQGGSAFPCATTPVRIASAAGSP